MPETYTDPKDTPVYLARNGWQRIEDAEHELWEGVYEGESELMQGLLRRTPSGTRRFYVRDPPDSFVSAAHDGDCLLTKRDKLTTETDDLFRVHFRSGHRPDTFGDGIDHIESQLE